MSEYPQGYLSPQIALFCEVSNQPYKPGESMQITHPQGNRMYVPTYRNQIKQASTVGDVVKALRRVASDMGGVHSDFPPDLWSKLEKASLCQEPV